MLKASKWFLAILLFGQVASASAGNLCEALFQSSSNHVVGRADATLEFRSKLERTTQALDGADLLNRAYDFSDSLALLAHFLPAAERGQFLQIASNTFSQTEVVSTDKAASRGLRYRSRFLDFGVNRTSKAKVRWTNGRVESQAELDQLVEDTIAVYTESLFTPIRRHTIYVRGKSTFIANNIDVMKTKLIYEMFTLGDRSPPEPGAFGTLVRQTRRIFGALLPMQFAAIRGLSLTKAHVDAFDRGGPQELYRYIKHREGLPLAVRYWVNHLTNAKLVIVLAYAAVLAPAAIDSWNYFATYQSFETKDDAQHETAKTLYKAIKTPPPEILQKISDDVQAMPREEQLIFKRALGDFPRPVNSSNLP